MSHPVQYFSKVQFGILDDREINSTKDIFVVGCSQQVLWNEFIDSKVIRRNRQRKTHDYGYIPLNRLPEERKVG